MIQIEPLEPRRLMAVDSPDQTFDDADHVAPLHAAERLRSKNVVVQSDGRFLVAGASDGKWALRRYLPDGSLDKRFGDEGVVDNFGVRDGRISVLAKSPDGGFFIAGRGIYKNDQSPAGPDTDLLIAKLKPNGRLDRSYRPDGANGKRPGFVRFRTTAESAFRDDEILKVLGGGGKVLTRLRDLRDNAWTFGRSAADSRPDSTFRGGAGFVPRGINFSTMPTHLLESPGIKYLWFRGVNGITAMAQAPDGSTVAAGYYVYAHGTVNENDKIPYVQLSLPYLLRIGSAGGITASAFVHPDISKMRGTHYTGLSAVPRRLAIAADGKIYLLGRQGVARFNADFTLDTTWSGDGIASTSVNSAHAATGEFVPQLADIALGADGNLLGMVQEPGARDGSAHDALVVRFNLDGTASAVARLNTLTPQEASAARAANASEVATERAILTAEGTDSVPRTNGRAAPAGAARATEVHPASADGVYTVDIPWRDGQPVSEPALNDGALQIVTPDGTTLSARAVSRTLRTDGSVLVRYQTPPVNVVTKTDAGDGRYEARELGKRIADVTGALAIGRTLGTFAVRVPEPILTTSRLAVGMSPERMRMAPNT